jgi:uncharacterized membrane protein (DUF485 family)
MGLTAEIARREKAIAVLGAALFAWFVFESVQFLYSGQLWDLGRTLPQFFHSSVPLGLYVVFHMLTASLGAFVAIPLMRGGRSSGLVLGVAYRLSGNTINRLSFPLPRALLVAQNNDPTVLAQAMDVLWLILSLAILLLYFFQRRIAKQ